MNRHERRRLSANEHKRRVAGILQFQKSTAGVMRQTLIRTSQYDEWLYAEHIGNQDAANVLKAIRNWWRDPERFNVLCLGCDATFTDEAGPQAFVVLLPFAKADRAIIWAVCSRCEARPDLNDVIWKWTRETWPNVYRIPHGGVQ